MESFSKVSQAKLFQVTHLSRNVKGREGEDGSNEGVLHRHGMIPVFTPLELSLVNVLGSGQLGQQWGTGWDGFIEARPARTIPLCPTGLAPRFIEGVKEAGSPPPGEKCLFWPKFFGPLLPEESSRQVNPY